MRINISELAIPKTFMLGGKTYAVVYDDNISWREGANGDVHIEMGIIRIQSDIRGRSTPQDEQERVFWHEAIHAALEAMGEKSLSQDERFVNGLGVMIHQILKTAQYD